MNSHRALALLVLGAVAFAVGFAAPQLVVAAPPPGAQAIGSGSPQLPAGSTVVDATQMGEIVDIVQRIEPYLYVDEAGIVRMRSVSAADLGVSDQFLADYRLAMTYSNALIERGEIRVAADMRVSMVSPPRIARSDEAALDGSAAGMASDLAGAGGGEAVPDWGGWNYGSGAMFYNSYPDWTYYRYNYYGLCNGMAAWIGMPGMGPVLIYFYGYNQYYFIRYCYPSYGTYFYIPYSHTGMPFGYKPAYFWAQQYGYCSNCRCYCYQWLWLGFWCRY